MNNTTNNLALLLQTLSLQILFQDFNNADLMQMLQKIIKQNEKIIELLERRESNE